MKCQSKRFESETGWAQKCGDGDGDDSESSAASFIKRRMVGDMVVVVVAALFVVWVFVRACAWLAAAVSGRCVPKLGTESVDKFVKDNIVAKSRGWLD